MSDIWKLMVKKMWPWAGPAPPKVDEPSRSPSDSPTPVEVTAPHTEGDGFPRTWQRKLADGDVERPAVFEPALKQFDRAYRQGEPAFQDVELGLEWRAARRRVIDHLLRIVGESPWKDDLILRGSMLLKVWIGDAAREPGDIDWVIGSPTAQVADLWTRDMFDGLVQVIAEQPRADNIDILVADTAVDDIWTYDRAPGRRIVIPWHASGLPAGSVQMDFVFQEEMASPALRTLIPTLDGIDVELWTASRELSLAWKILWLETDMYPQGKDLYDAVLLAEHVDLPASLLNQVLSPAFRGSSPTLVPDLIREWHVDWENFQLEYPWVEGGVREWQERLVQALAPTFAESDGG